MLGLSFWKAHSFANILIQTDLVILDELGYLPFSQTGGALLFHLIRNFYERTSIIITCPSYKFRPAQKSGPFRVVPDSVCDPHTILLHGVLSNFRSRAMR